MPTGELGGPDSEMFWDFGAELGIHEKSEFRESPCHVNCDCGRFLEIGNNVFMQYIKTESGFDQLPKGNIDFGGGLERILAASNGDPDIFKTDLFIPIIDEIEKLSGKKYEGSTTEITAETTDEHTDEFTCSYEMRIIADHLKAATFLIADGVVPSNTQQGYVLRRLIRRAVRYGHLLEIKTNFAKIISEVVISIYKESFPELEKNKEKIFTELENEEAKFGKTISAGLTRLNKIVESFEMCSSEKSDGAQFVDMNDEVADMIFDLYQTYGFPLELVLEEFKNNKVNVDEVGLTGKFNERFKKHQELSRTASAGMFKGGMSDTSEISIKYHTATHLLLAALREILGPETYQKGSNITAERLRFDFNYPEKLTLEQITEIEDLVNKKIEENIEVVMTEMPKDEALKVAKVSFDPEKYGDIVKVYKIDDFSIELCGGPHVKNTGELGHFKIVKEESSSAAVRRIKAVLS
jgi:alanyl-tRNA synthetase